MSEPGARLVKTLKGSTPCSVIEEALLILREVEIVLTAERERVIELENMLEDVVNELTLSDCAIKKHGPLGTPPAELVRAVLRIKDLHIRVLQSGWKVVDCE